MALHDFNYGNYELTNCCNCGTVLAMSETVYQKRLSDGGSFYCPNGHRQHFTESDEKTIEDLRRKLKSEKQRREWANERADKAELQRRAQKGVATRRKHKLDRVQCGVCPECNRSLTNLRRHMKTKHDS